MTWDSYLLKLSRMVAEKSKDRSTKVGCVIVSPDHEIRATGYNGFVRGADDYREDWHQRPKKYEVTIHAEVNAVASSAKSGTSLEGCTAYVSLRPCSRCTATLIQAGIKRIVYIKDDEKENDPIWRDNFEIAREIIKEAGIVCIGIYQKP